MGAYGAGSLTAARSVCGPAGGGCESASTIGRGTKWSVAPEGVWQREGRRALERRGRETQGSLEQRKRPALWVGRLPPGPGTERPIRWARGNVAGAGYGGDSRPGSDAESGKDGYNLDAGGTAQSVAGSAGAGRRRMPESRSAMTDTVCANSRERKRTAVSCLPGTLPAGFFPAEVWRNSRQV